MDKAIDYRYCLDFLQRVNASMYQGKPLSQSFFIDSYNVWHWYQQFLFSEIKEYSKNSKYYKGHVRLGVARSLTFGLLGIFLLSITWHARIKIRLKKIRIAIYAIDKLGPKYKSDIRLDSVYDALESTHTPFVEIFHTLISKNFLTSFLSRRRLAVYLEAPDVVYFYKTLFKKKVAVNTADLDLGAFGAGEKDFVVYLIRNFVQTVPQTHHRIKYWKKFFQSAGLTKFLLIDDTRHWHELIYAAKASAVETLAFQHGHVTKYHVGFLKNDAFTGNYLFPDTYFVWDKYWHDELIRINSIFPEQRLVVASPRSTWPVVSIQAPSQRLRVVIPYETDAPKDDVKRHIATLASAGAEIILKLRADMSKEDQIAQYVEEGTTVRATFDTPHAKDADVALGVYSSLLYDFVAAGVPTGILESSLDYGEGMIKNGLANLVRMSQTFEDTKALAGLDSDERKRRAELLASGKTIKEVLAVILSKV